MQPGAEECWQPPASGKGGFPPEPPEAFDFRPVSDIDLWNYYFDKSPLP